MTDAPDPDEKPKTPKVRQRRPEEVKKRILAAALEAFATHGFAGTSTRDIAKAAHVRQSLTLYHYPTKEILWRSVIEDVYGKFPFFTNDDEVAANHSASERLHKIIRNIVKIFAEAPALHRLMTLEAHQPSERLIWICDQFLATDFHQFCELILEAQREGKVRDVNPGRLRFAILAMAAVPFAVSAEYQYLTKRNPFSSAEIENAIEFINRIVFVDE